MSNQPAAKLRTLWGLLTSIKIPPILKKLLAVAVIITTFAIFGFYISDHPKLLDALYTLDAPTVIMLTIGYTITILVNALVLLYSLRFIGTRSSVLDNFILTGYSSIVNFFGPLQSGPGFRAIYLKRKYNVRIRDFFVTTLIFYGFFAALNVLILIGAGLYRLSSPLVFGIAFIIFIVVVSGAIVAARRIPKLTSLIHAMKISSRNFWLIGLGALALIVATTLIYHVELTHVNPGINIFQTLVYTAAADLALFVALTPGAIGFRESFIVLSQQLHSIDTSTIVGASIIDRAFYVVFLLALFAILLIINSRKHLLVFRTKTK